MRITDPLQGSCRCLPSAATTMAISWRATKVATFSALTPQPWRVIDLPATLYSAHNDPQIAALAARYRSSTRSHHHGRSILRPTDTIYLDSTVSYRPGIDAHVIIRAPACHVICRQ
jgi:hypothetical protein